IYEGVEAAGRRVRQILVQTLIPALLLCAILALLAPPVQEALRRLVEPADRLGRARVFIGPLVLSAVFSLALRSCGVRDTAPLILILAYTLAPTLVVYTQ